MDRRFYPSFEDDWDNRRFGELVGELIGPQSTVLDFGAGRGALEELSFKDRAAKVVGVDADEAVLQNPHLDEAKVLRLPEGVIPYPEGSFDLVFSNNVLEHLAAPEGSLKEILRVLKPGGVFLAKTPNKAHYIPLVASLTPHAFHVFYNRLRGREEQDTFPTLYRCNTRRRIGRLARAAGFSVVDIAAWEGRPEYLRVAAPLYLLGLLYERLVNLSSALAGFRAVLVVELRKPTVPSGADAAS